MKNAIIGSGQKRKDATIKAVIDEKYRDKPNDDVNVGIMRLYDSFVCDYREKSESSEKEPSEGINYWLYAPGRGGEHWDDFYSNGIIAIGWDYLGDLQLYDSKDDIANAIREHDKEPDSSKKNNATSCYSFANDMQIGDIVFAKVGNSKIVGWGEISSDYKFRPRYCAIICAQFILEFRRFAQPLFVNWTFSKYNKWTFSIVTIL